MALACEPPEEHGLPITHWTHKELAQEAVKPGIVEAISPSHVGNILKKRLGSSYQAADTRKTQGYEGYHIVLDQLNTHKSETLVCTTAENRGPVMRSWPSPNNSGCPPNAVFAA